MRPLIVVGAALFAVGCANDPCDGKSGVCISLRVEGAVSGLDQLDVTVDQPTMETKQTPVAPFTLPVQIALSLPAGVSGTVAVTVIGRGGGNAIAQGATSVVVSGTRGKATVTLSAGTIGGGDGGDQDMTGGGSTDMAGCAQVSVCMSGDGCCPSSCDAVSDADCPSVCGNNVVEPGEVCDDHNTNSGDGCDATCRWHETLDKISGNPGASGHADDSSGYSRLSQPSGVTADAANNRLYFTSSNDCTVRQGDNATSPTVTNLVGKAWDCTAVDGAFAAARFAGPTDVELLGNAIYVVDNNGGSIRKIDLAAKTVSTIVTTSLQGLGHFGAKLAYFDLGAGLRTYDPSTGTFTTVAALASFNSNVVQSQFCYDVACDATNCYVACGGSIAKVLMSSGAVSNYVGAYNPGNGTWATGCTDAATNNLNAKLSLAFHVTVDALGNLFATDITCHNVEKITTTQTSRFAGQLGSYGYADGFPLTQAYFHSPGGITSIGTDFFVADHDNDSVRWIGANAADVASDVFTVAGLPHNYVESTFVATPPVTNPNYGNGFSGLASDGINEYAVDGNGRILKIGVASGSASLLVPAAAWGVTTSFGEMVRIGPSLYVLGSNGTIMSVGVDGNGATLYAGTPNPSTPPSDGGRLSAVMYPRSLATDGTSLFFSDSGKLIRSIDAAGMVHTLAGDYTSTDLMDGTGAAAHLVRASALTTDGKYVYFADSTMAGQGAPPPGAIRRTEIATGKVDTIAGSTTANGHVDGAGAAARFSGIASLATDGVSVFVADVDDFVEQRLGIAPVIRQLVLKTMIVGTDVGTLGQQTFKPGIASAARVHSPGLLTFDSTTHALLFFDQAEYAFGRIK